jgi:hypothetical protein
MKRQTAKIQSLKGKIATLINLVKLGIKKYICQLVELEGCLESAQHSQLFTEAQIKAAFEKVGGNWREWHKEFTSIIPNLKKLEFTGDEFSNLWFAKFPQVFAKFDEIGVSDWQIVLCIKAANTL